MSEKTMPVIGGCLCGAVRYESTEPPIFVGYCHCRMCQRAYGALYGLFAAFPLKAFRYTRGEPTYFRSSTWAKRGFCSNCGSPVDMWYGDDDPEPGVLIGTLDHPEEWPPDSEHIGIESKVPWHTINDDLPQRRTEESQGVQDAQARAHNESDRQD